MTFEDDEKRREYFLEKLREKLKDPEFRKIEGFPIGEDEDILALSDPPYYTACPNPFIEDFIKHYGKPYDPDVPYSREPFAVDVSEGKTDPIYKAHTYHTKVPHLAIVPSILHYTEPGDVHPQFLKEIGGWQKYEKALELSVLLGENFLRYDGKGEVPSQIHSYLSSNFKKLRTLAKDNPSLKAKAKDRWYVPDPNKAGDLEKLRERTLMREFEEYRESKQRRLKVLRLEAVRAGFKKALQERDYATIIAVAEKIPERILQEDSKLLMWYDQALTRMGKEMTC